MARSLPLFSGLVALLAAGVVHGVWTDRWAAGPTAAGNVDRVARSLGDWQAHDLEMDPRLRGPVAGFLYRRYVNQRTGAAVAVTLVGGRPGPVAIHTPDICYAAGGFEPLAESTVDATAIPGLPAGQFKTALFVKARAADRTQMRVLWSWNAGGAWQVSESPRFAFARHPVLFKLHLARELASASEPLEEDPCIELLRLLLPEVQKSVLSTP